MTKEELEKAAGQELIEQRDYCGVDGYYGDYLDDVNAEMLKRFNRLAELEKELKEWKDEWQEQVQKAINEGYARTLQTMQLTKAKKLLKQFLEAKNSEDTYKAEWEAEQFLKEIKEKANLKSNIKREIFPEIILPEGSEEHIDKVIADAEKRLGD